MATLTHTHTHTQQVSTYYQFGKFHYNMQLTDIKIILILSLCCIFSVLQDPNKRFGKSLGALSGGRISITRIALVNLKLALTVAIRYSATRKQFGPKDTEEIPVLEYQLQVRIGVMNLTSVKEVVSTFYLFRSMFFLWSNSRIVQKLLN